MLGAATRGRLLSGHRGRVTTTRTHLLSVLSRRRVRSDPGRGTPRSQAQRYDRRRGPPWDVTGSRTAQRPVAFGGRVVVVKFEPRRTVELEPAHSEPDRRLGDDAGRGHPRVPQWGNLESGVPSLSPRRAPRSSWRNFNVHTRNCQSYAVCRSRRGAAAVASCCGAIRVSKYLHVGWHEFFIPVWSLKGLTHLRVWIDMEDVLPMLRHLDAVYGDDDHPYAMRVEQIPDAQRDLIQMVIDHVLEQPGAVRRVSASRQLAAELAERFGVGQSQFPLEYPEVIDQDDLDPSQLMLILPLIIHCERQKDAGTEA